LVPLLGEVAVDPVWSVELPPAPVELVWAMAMPPSARAATAPAMVTIFMKTLLFGMTAPNHTPERPVPEACICYPRCGRASPCGGSDRAPQVRRLGFVRP
jgi:hypothetical protein